MPEKQERQEDVLEKSKFLKVLVQKVFFYLVMFMRKNFSEPLINVIKCISYKGKDIQNCKLSLQ